MSSGDTLMLDNGTYNETPPGYGFTPPAGINAANPTIIKAVNANQAIVTPPGGGVGGFNFGSNNYITLDGININCQGRTPYCAGVGSNNGNHDYVIKNGTIQHTGGLLSDTNNESSAFECVCDNVLVQNMTFNDNGSGNNLDHALYVIGNHWVIENNRIYNTNLAGIGEAISIRIGSGSLTDLVVRNNEIHATNGPGLLVNLNTSNIQIYNNLFYGNRRGVYLYNTTADNIGIYNNVFYNNSDNGISVDFTAPTNTSVRNNIFYSNGAVIDGDALSSTTCDHNLGVPGDTTSTTCSASSSGTNPQFTNAAAAQFTLTAASLSAIGKGVDLSGTFTTDFTGTTRTVPWDVGAYKFVTAAPGTPPVDDLSGYTLASALNGKNGGSADWTGPYNQAGTSDFTIVAKPAAFPSGQAAEVVNAGGALNVIDLRPFTAITSGPVPFRINTTSCSPSSGQMAVGLKSATGDDLMIARISGGNFQIYDGGIPGYSTVVACSTGVTKGAFVFSTAGHPNQYAVQFANGTTSSFVNVVPGTYSSVAGIFLQDTDVDAHTFDVGAIGINPDYAVFTTSPTNVVSGVGMSPSPIVTIRAPGATTDTTFTSNVTLTISACGASISSGGTVAAVAGVATFNSLILSTAASGCTFTAAATNVDTSVASSSFNVTSAFSASASGVNRRRRR